MNIGETTKTAGPDGRGALLAGGLAAILASTCCVGPLVLLMLGVSGAWIGSLTALEPFRPAFIAIALVAMFFAHRRIWRPAVECEPGAACATPGVNRGYRFAFIVVAALILVAIAFPYFAPLFY